MDRPVLLGRACVRAYPSRELRRIRCQVLRTLRSAGGAEGGEAVGLQPQELRPGRPDPAGRGTQAAVAKHRGDRRRRDIDAKLQELASDPEVAPPGVLTTEPEDQVFDRRIEGRTTGPARAAHAPPQQIPVPSHQGLRTDQEAPPPVPGQHPSRGRQEGPIGRGEWGSSAAATEDLELVAEHGLLEIQLLEASADEQAE
jgi:hypothetical protein